MFDLNTLKFDEMGLIPAIVVDTNTKQVLTLAYMNQESLEISMREGCTCFWSRSRQELSTSSPSPLTATRTPWSSRYKRMARPATPARSPASTIPSLTARPRQVSPTRA